MLAFPIFSADHKRDMLFIIMDKMSHERMLAADPATVSLPPALSGGRKLVDPTVIVCYEDDTPEFARVLQTRDWKEIGRYLMCGFTTMPGDGEPPRRLWEDS